MTAREQNGFLMSAGLHGLVIALAVLWSFVSGLNEKQPVKILELVAGEGTNYGATEAPALGTPGGVKLTVPAPAPPKPEPVAAEPTPVAPTPPPPAVTKAPTQTKPPPASPNFAKQILRKLYNADAKAKREVAKEREEEQKRMTKAEFDRANKARAAEKNSPANLKRIDSEGIAKGVAGGSTANKEGGAGGRALTSTEGSARERYDAALIAALRRALEEEKPPGLSESLVATVVFHVSADGTLSNIRITKPSGSREFDSAVRAAIRRVGSIGPRPDHRGEEVELDFRAKEQDGD